MYDTRKLPEIPSHWGPGTHQIFVRATVRVEVQLQHYRNYIFIIPWNLGWVDVARNSERLHELEPLGLWVDEGGSLLPENRIQGTEEVILTGSYKIIRINLQLSSEGSAWR